MIGEIPAHTHDLPASFGGITNKESLVASDNNDEGFNGNNQSGSNGGGGSHNNLQPYFVVLTLIKL